MPAIQGPNLGLNYGWPLGESGWNTGMDANLKKLDALIQLTVASATTSVPASPTSGDRYIVPVGATGAWAGQDGKIARYDVNAWEFFTASTGWTAEVLDTGHRLRWNGSSWVKNTVLPSGDTIIDVTLTEYTEVVASPSTVISATGSIRPYTMTANTTFTDGLDSGQSATLLLSGANVYTPDFPTMVWVGGVPTLGANAMIEFVKVGATLYGAHVGDY